MSGVPTPPTKISFRQRLLKTIQSKPASLSAHALTSSAAQSSVSLSTRISRSSSSPTAALLVSNSTLACATPPTSQQASSTSSVSRNLLVDALKQISVRDQLTLQDVILPNSSDIDLALSRALDAAKEKQRLCIEKRWTFTFSGRSITLREEADKVVRWLNRFKDVGNVAVSADPVHAGLPWAGIRLLLEAAVSEANQMTSLMAGCETVLYMANRLKAYMDFLYGLPATLTRANFESAMTELYAHILQFLAQAIQIYQTPTFHRTVRAFWKESDISEFETTCNELGTRVEIEASNCDRTLSAQDRERTGKLKRDLQTVLEEIQKSRQLQDSLSQIKIKIDLDKLPHAKGAMYNSYGDEQMMCHPATRVDLLHQIKDWARHSDSKNIFWLSGMAGTGKSTISRTVAEWLTAQRGYGVVDLGASFFFKRGEGDRGSASRFFPTITRELVLKVPGMDSLVADVVTSDPFIFDKTLGEQFDKLIYQPLQKVKATASGSPTLIVVVDALDECEKEGDIKAIIALWSRLPHITTVRLRLFLTSRPDLPVRLGFETMSVDAYQNLILQDVVPENTIHEDIFTFLKDEFLKIRKQHPQLLANCSPNHDWPGDVVLQSLVDMAVPLFIIAATVSRYVGELNPPKRLEKILGFQKQGKLGQIGQMEQTYLPVLTQRPATFLDSDEEEEFFHNFRTIVGSIVTLAEPLSSLSLAALLGVDEETITFQLRPLHSVLRVPTDVTIPIRALHLSFSEFLSGDKVQNEPFGVNGPTAHHTLLKKCLELLSKPNGLRENMCDLKWPGQPRQEVESTTINDRLSPALQYACRYWVHHARCSKVEIYDEGKVHVFLRAHFLHLLEALSLMDRIAEVIEQVRVLQSLLAPSNSSDLSCFLEDARRVVFANRYVVNLAPLQIYSSAMIFAPQTSIVKKICGKILTWVKTSPITPPTWSSELQKLEGHTGGVNAVAFSPDGSLLASASWDETVRLWDPATGQEVQSLEGHTGEVNAVAFSPDGSLLASASWDETVRLWDPATGQEVQKLEGHTGGVNAVAFSPDGSLLASASRDETVRLWDPATGQEVQKLEGHTGGVNAVAFSPDCSLLASASRDRTVRLWDPATGQEVQKLEGHTGGVNAVAFSPDGSLLASASRDRTVRLWDPATGQEVQKLEGHTGGVNAVAFSANGSLLASASRDQTIRLWDPATGQEVQKLEKALFTSTISFSIDNKTILTDQGALHINSRFISDNQYAPATTHDFPRTDAVTMNDSWVQQGLRNLLWLSHEYRGSCTDVHGKMLAIGQYSGHVSFVQVNYR